MRRVAEAFPGSDRGGTGVGEVMPVTPHSDGRLLRLHYRLDRIFQREKILRTPRPRIFFLTLDEAAD